MKKRINFKKSVLLLLFPIALIIKTLSQNNPNATEKIYTDFLYKKTVPILSSIIGFLPFSLAELTLLFCLFFVMWKLINFVIFIMKNKPSRKEIFNKLIFVLSLVSIIYFFFILLWGLNYYRKPFSTLTNLEVKPSTVTELYDLCEELSLRANSLRKYQAEDSRKVMKLTNKISTTLNRAHLGYDRAGLIYKELQGSYGTPKLIMLSGLMSYTQITGFYFPYTGEANINISIPALEIPATICHEMAHQRGFAREDEANYIAYLTCTLHPDLDFQYSGTMLALMEASNALYRQDKDAYKKLTQNYSFGVANDLMYYYKYWSKYDGIVSEVSNKINDTYLKSNNQNQGVQSYGRMVDLLLAEYRQKN